jgi:hypothetical protein
MIGGEGFNTLTTYVRFEVLTATMKNAVFWDIKTQFVPNGKHLTSLLHNPAGKCCVRFEVLMAVTVNNAVFCDVKPCGCLYAELRQDICLVLANDGER